MDNSYRFFNNRECKYFPCHKAIKEEDFNCLFCYCPLYFTGEKCGGNFKMYGTIKDCSNCNIPHQSDSYDYIINKIKLINEDIAKENEK